MKIGILTYHSAYNFGANLQAFATVCYLKSLGHDPWIIDYGRDIGNTVYRKMVPREQWIGHDRFIEEKLPLTVSVNSKQELIELTKSEKFDGIIVGADAVWSYPARYAETPIFFLDWLFETPEISSIPAATMSVANMSGGYKHLSLEKREKLKTLIPKFSYLTVRDGWTREAVNKHIFGGKNVVQVLNPDPVFILNDLLKENLNRLDLVGENEKYILCTFPKDSSILRKWFAKFIKQANTKGFIVGELPLPEGRSNLLFDFTVPYPIDPLQWYLWIKNSNGFVGMRFHAVVSCISAGTPFFSIDNYGSQSLIVKVINHIGCYRLGRVLDYRSKIFQLLKSTRFKGNRVHGMRGLWGTNPLKVLNKLLKTREGNIQDLRDILKKTYIQNIKKILEAFERNSK